MEHCRLGSMTSAQYCRGAQRCLRSIGERLLLSRVVFWRKWINASEFWRSGSGWSAEVAVMMVLSCEAGKFISTSLIKVNISIELREIEKMHLGFTNGTVPALVEIGYVREALA